MTKLFPSSVNPNHYYYVVSQKYVFYTFTLCYSFSTLYYTDIARTVHATWVSACSPLTLPDIPRDTWGCAMQHQDSLPPYALSCARQLFPHSDEKVCAVCNTWGTEQELAQMLCRACGVHVSAGWSSALSQARGLWDTSFLKHSHLKVCLELLLFMSQFLTVLLVICTERKNFVLYGSLERNWGRVYASKFGLSVKHQIKSLKNVFQESPFLRAVLAFWVMPFPCGKDGVGEKCIFFFFPQKKIISILWLF